MKAFLRAGMLILLLPVILYSSTDLSAFALAEDGRPESAFWLTDNRQLKKAAEQGLSAKVNQTLTVGGTTITVTDLLYDGVSIYIGYIQEPFKREEPYNIHFKANGKEIESYNYDVSEKRVTENKSAYALTLTPSEPFPDPFILNMTMEQEGSQQSIHLPVRKIKGVRSYSFNESRTFQDQTYTVKMVTITPIVTAVSFYLKQPPTRRKESPVYRLYSDNGMMLDHYGSGGGKAGRSAEQASRYTATFEPLSGKPEYLVFQPAVQKATKAAPRKVKADLNGRFPLTLKQGDAGFLTITDIRYKKDETLVYYHVRGRDPYAQANALWLQDSRHTQYGTVRQPLRLNNTDYDFSAAFPPINRNQSLTAYTVRLPFPESLPQLKMKLSLIHKAH